MVYLPTCPGRNAAPMHNEMTRSWVEIDLGALQDNARTMRNVAGVPLLPMVKADAYGLGAIPVARALDALDPWGFGVGTVQEGVTLRAAGIRRPILVFTPVLVEDLPAVREAGLTPTLSRAAAIEAWTVGGGGAWHLAIDTGMSREGVRWDCTDAVRDTIRALPPEGAYTHFHSANRDDGTKERQAERFAGALRSLAVAPPLLHCEASAAIERCGGSRWNLVRPGVFLYGVASTADGVPSKQVVSLRARVVDLRTIDDGDTVSYQALSRADGPQRIATLGIGYADGYRRCFTGRGVVLIRGQRAPVVGAVTMDMIMVNVTDIPCDVGDVATLIGRDGDDALELCDVADMGNLSPYELLTGLRMRARHVYTGGAA